MRWLERPFFWLLFQCSSPDGQNMRAITKWNEVIISDLMWNFSKTLFQTHKSFRIEYKLYISVFKWFIFQKQECRPTKNSSVSVCVCVNQNILGTQCGVLVHPVVYGKYPILSHPIALWYWAPAAALGKRGCFVFVFLLQGTFSHPFTPCVCNQGRQENGEEAKRKRYQKSIWGG